MASEAESPVRKKRKPLSEKGKQTLKTRMETPEAKHRRREENRRAYLKRNESQTPESTARRKEASMRDYLKKKLKKAAEDGMECEDLKVELEATQMSCDLPSVQMEENPYSAESLRTRIALAFRKHYAEKEARTETETPQAAARREVNRRDYLMRKENWTPDDIAKRKEACRRHYLKKKEQKAEEERKKAEEESRRAEKERRRAAKGRRKAEVEEQHRRAVEKCAAQGIKWKDVGKGMKRMKESLNYLSSITKERIDDPTEMNRIRATLGSLLAKGVEIPKLSFLNSLTVGMRRKLKQGMEESEELEAGSSKRRRRYSATCSDVEAYEEKKRGRNARARKRRVEESLNYLTSIEKGQLEDLRELQRVTIKLRNLMAKGVEIPELPYLKSLPEVFRERLMRQRVEKAEQLEKCPKGEEEDETSKAQSAEEEQSSEGTSEDETDSEGDSDGGRLHRSTRDLSPDRRRKINKKRRHEALLRRLKEYDSKTLRPRREQPNYTGPADSSSCSSSESSCEDSEDDIEESLVRRTSRKREIWRNSPRGTPSRVGKRPPSRDQVREEARRVIKSEEHSWEGEPVVQDQIERNSDETVENCDPEIPPSPIHFADDVDEKPDISGLSEPQLLFHGDTGTTKEEDEPRDYTSISRRCITCWGAHADRDCPMPF